MQMPSPSLHVKQAFSLYLSVYHPTVPPASYTHGLWMHVDVSMHECALHCPAYEFHEQPQSLSAHLSGRHPEGGVLGRGQGSRGGVVPEHASLRLGSFHGCLERTALSSPHCCCELWAECALLCASDTSSCALDLLNQDVAVMLSRLADASWHSKSISQPQCI